MSVATVMVARIRVIITVAVGSKSSFSFGVNIWERWTHKHTCTNSKAVININLHLVATLRASSHSLTVKAIWEMELKQLHLGFSYVKSESSWLQ